jgi:hypothetical protein
MVLSRGWQEAEFSRQIAELGLARYVRMHPFIPHWRIPGFIRACNAVAFLERDFAIQAHTPTIPSEVLSCGTCLIVSEEVLRKQIFRADARQRQNLIVVADPRDHTALARAVRYALQDTERARQIGLAGHDLTKNLPDVADYVDGLERVLQSVIGEPAPACTRPNVAAERDERIEPVAVVERLYPYTAALLGTRLPTTARASLSGSMIGSEPVEPREFAIAVGGRLLDGLESLGEEHVVEMCRYELMMHEWAPKRDPATEPARGAGAFDGADLTLSSTEISLRGDIAIEAFQHDVEALALMTTGGEALPDDTNAQFRCENGLLVLFHRGSFPHKVSRATATLLCLLREGALTVAQLHSQLSAALGVSTSDISAEDLADILQGLFWEGIIGAAIDQRPPSENAQPNKLQARGVA